MKISLRLPVPLPVYKLTENTKVAIDKKNNYIYVQSELCARSALCASCSDETEQNIELNITENEESQYTVIHLVLFKIVDYNYKPMDINKEKYNKNLKNFCDYVKDCGSSFLEQNYILLESDSMMQNFEILHKHASLPFTIKKPVKESEPINFELNSRESNGEVAAISKTSSHNKENSTWFNYKTAGAVVVTLSAFGFFAMQSMAGGVSSQNELGNGFK
jgi:hypothetical protein